LGANTTLEDVVTPHQQYPTSVLAQVCPPGCDPVLYDSVVELREHRLDEEDVAAEVAKALEALGKDKMMLAKKAKLVDTALTAINQVGLPQGWGFGCP
jgi:hypothetical protein